MKLENKVTQTLTHTQKISLKQHQSLKVLEMNTEEIQRLIEKGVLHLRLFYI